MYAIVPAIDGVPQVGTRIVYSGVSISNTSYEKAVVHIDDGNIESGWTQITEEEFRQYLPEHDLEDGKQERVSEQEIINSELLLAQAEILESNRSIEEAQALILLELIGGDK